MIGTPTTPAAREQCQAFGHIWLTIAHGLDQCARCGSEIADLTVPPLILHFEGCTLPDDHEGPCND